MRLLSVLASCVALASAAILQNGQIRNNPYPGQPTEVTLSAANTDWKAHPANASQLSYKGRWDDQYISWWSAPGLVFGFTGDNVAISFGTWTSPGVLIAWRLDGLDWNFANVTANATYQFVNSTHVTSLSQAPSKFEFRVTNWALGVQVAGVWTSSSGSLKKIPNYPLMIEVIGDSLSAGQYATYEGISSYSWGLAEGMGNTEFSLTAYPGICLHDEDCWGNLHGMTYQYKRVSDTSYRSQVIYGNDPPMWKFGAQQKADIVIINLGTNDANGGHGPGGMVSSSNFTSSYIQLINNVHNHYPKAQVICLSLWEGFGQVGNTYQQGGAYIPEIMDVVNHFQTNANANFVHYFNTTGILQHNDIGPQYHPTDVGHVKIASHLKEYLRQQFGWVLAATGPEVQHDTLYWNDQQNY